MVLKLKNKYFHSSFRVERTDAGFAELDVTVTSPLGGELPLEIKRVAKEWGEVDLVEFMPEAAGIFPLLIMRGEISILRTGGALFFQAITSS